MNKLLMQKAGGLLASRPYSRGELRSRLIKIAGESAVEPVLDRLEKLHLLNDADYAYNFALCRMRQNGWGPAKIRRTLLLRHVDRTTVDSALERVRNQLDSQMALAEYLRKYCSKRGIPANVRSLRRLILHLHQRGFDEESILDVVQHSVPASLWRRFETGECID